MAHDPNYPWVTGGTSHEEPSTNNQPLERQTTQVSTDPTMPLHGRTATFQGLGSPAPAGQVQGPITDPLGQYGRPQGGVSYQLPYVDVPEFESSGDWSEQVNAEMIAHYKRKKPNTSHSDQKILSMIEDVEHDWDSDDKGSPYREPAIKSILAQQAGEEESHAKYWNEYRYAQGLDFLNQRFENVMGQLAGYGDQETKDIRRQFTQARSKMDQSALGTGLTGTTVRGAEFRGMQAEESTALGRAREQSIKTRLGYESMLTSDIVNFVKDRTDTYPDVGAMANLYFGYGSGGSGSGRAGEADTGGSAAAGIGAGLALAFLCCWIFMEVYGKELDEIVRRYRNEKMTLRNRRGYYRMSEFLIPLMRKSWVLKQIVRYGFCEPLLAYGRWYYAHEVRTPSIWRHLGWVFAPVKAVWMTTLDVLGGSKEFVRANGEAI
jgi:hypothetical protein